MKLNALTRAVRENGFTLIELLVVIAIVGLLAVVAMVGMNVARSRSRDTKRIADVKQIQKALDIYYIDNLSYPTVAAATNLGEGTALALCGSTLAATCSGTAYMARIPDAPTVVESGCAASNYVYTSSATSGVSSSYTIAFCLGNAIGNVGAGNRTASPTGIQ